MWSIAKPVRLLLAAALALCLAAPVLGDTDIYEGDTNNYNHDVTDYHITIKSKGPITGAGGVLSDDGTFPKPDISGEGTKEVSFDWWYLDVPPGDSIGFCIHFEAGRGYSIEKSFTAVKGTVEHSLPVLGGSENADGSVALTNAYRLPISFSNLQYTVQWGPLADSGEEGAQMFEEVAEGIPFALGWEPLPGGVVPPESATPVLESAPTQPGEALFLYYESEFEDGMGQSFTVIREEKGPDVKPVNGF